MHWHVYVVEERSEDGTL